MHEVKVTVRRNMQQIVHCAIEALSAHEHKEDPFVVLADLDQARGLIEIVTRRIREGETQ
jgi:hypothetical protein